MPTTFATQSWLSGFPYKSLYILNFSNHRKYFLKLYGFQTFFFFHKRQFGPLGDSRKYPYHTTDGFKDFRRGGGIHDYGILKAWGGIYDLKSEGMGEFHRWDFWSRKCRVSSWKTLLLWTFVVRK